MEKSAGAHNAIYRGKDITDLFYNGTLSQQVAAGTLMMYLLAITL